MKPKRNLAPQAVADACLEHAWDDDCDDKSRRLLEHASNVIEQLQERLVKQACFFEQIEAQIDHQWPLIKDEDPGVGL